MATRFNYEYTGKLYVDRKADKATLYISVNDPERREHLPQLRLGFKNFSKCWDNPQQTLSACVLRDTGEAITGVTCFIWDYTPESGCYQIDIDVGDGVETLQWAKQGHDGLVASDSSRDVSDIWRKTSRFIDVIREQAKAEAL